MQKNVFITGATDGIGKQSAVELCRLGYHVIIHGRSSDSVDQALDEIKAQSGKEDITGYAAEFEHLSEISDLAAKLRNSYNKLDVLINNAGIFQKKREVTGDGFEKTFQVNYLAHFLLTLLILDLLEKAEKSRVVNVSSMVHATAIDFDNLQGEQRFEGSSAYGLSKLCNVLFTYKLAREKQGAKLTVNSLHPGVISTKLLKQNYGNIGSAVEEGADNIVYVATAEEIGNVSGKYFVNKMPQGSATISYETGVQDRLWDISLDLVREYLD